MVARLESGVLGLTPSVLLDVASGHTYEVVPTSWPTLTGTGAVICSLPVGAAPAGAAVSHTRAAAPARAATRGVVPSLTFFRGLTGGGLLVVVTDLIAEA